MLSHADRALVERDPALPGLAVLLDDEATGSILAAPVRRSYLRYKPGTSCVLGAVAELPSGPAHVFLTAYDAEGLVKVDKLVAGAPLGSVLAFDRTVGVVAARAAADRDLPFLALLEHERRLRRCLSRMLPEMRGLREARVSTLRYKPMRRWVGLVQPAGGPAFVLRAYRPADAAEAAARVGELADAEARTPRLLGADLPLGLLAVEYLPGGALDDIAAGEAELLGAGRALALLHGHAPCGLAGRTGLDDAAAVRASAAQITSLLPDIVDEVEQLAEDLARRLGALSGGSAVLHGDFSADQVVVGPSGDVGLLDLDRAAVGHPAIDLASFRAAQLTHEAIAGRAPENLTRQLLAGYAELRPLPAEQAIDLHTAALLLRRAAEPFRLCLPEWPQLIRLLVSRAADLAAGQDPLAQSPKRLLTPLVGAPVRLEVLKDKPGRRRTSRASGPRGTAIVKVYASQRAPVVAARIRALENGPHEPVLPRVLLCDKGRHLVVLTEVAGAPFRESLLAGDLSAACRVGGALGSWHAAHQDRAPAGLRPHTVEREIQTLLGACARAPESIATAVRRALPALSVPWQMRTAVHRDLYEEQIVLGDRVGLLDLDDAAAGPAELDVGNLLAHMALLAQRSAVDLRPAVAALLDSYVAVAPLDPTLLDRCRSLSLLRLACLHSQAALLAAAENDESTLTRPSSAVHPAGAG